MANVKSKAANRFIIFVVRNVIILSFIAAILLMAFFISMDIANLNMLISDGMRTRTEAILTPSDVNSDEVMGKFFTREYILTGDKTVKEKYIEYDINDQYSYKVKIDKLWCWPWQVSTSAIVTETVTNITGTLQAEKQPESADDVNPPEWKNGKYKIYFKKVNSAWKIESIELIKSLQVTITPTKKVIYPSNIITQTPKPNTTTPSVSRSGVVTTDGSPIRLRSDPSTTSDANIIARIDNGVKVTILANEGNDWLKIKFGDKEGFVSKQFIVEDT